MNNENAVSLAPNQRKDCLHPNIQQLGPIELRPVAELRNYHGNPRRHSEKQISKLMASIRTFGFTAPALIGASNEVIVGEARIKAAAQLGMTEIPVIVATDWADDKIRAYRIADNRLAELASWDEKLLAIEFKDLIEIEEISIDVIGFETAAIDILLGELGSDKDASSDPADSATTLPNNPVTQVGDTWQLGKHRILCGSSLESDCWNKFPNEHTPAMVFTDAPYNVRVDGHVCGLGKVQHKEFAMASGEMNSEQFTKFLTDAFRPMAAATRDGGLLYLCMDWRHLEEILAAIRSCDLKLLNICVWNKTNGGMGSLYRSKHELVLVVKKGNAPHTNNVELGRHGRYRTNVWDYAGVNSFGASRMEDLADHPTVKPVALVADAIRDVTKIGEIVLDGFLGSGTTILAAERTKRVAYGIEIEPAYVDVAIRRWQDMTGQEAVLTDNGQSFAEVTAKRNSGASLAA